MRPFAATLIALVGLSGGSGVSGSSQGGPTERLPNATFENFHPRWLGWVAPRPGWLGHVDTSAAMTNEATFSLAVAVDSRGVSHMVFATRVFEPDEPFVIEPTANAVWIVYQNDLQESRSISGFSRGVYLARTHPTHADGDSRNNEQVRDPRIAVDPMGNIHVVWVQWISWDTFQPRNDRYDIYYKVKRTTGWSPTINLTPDDPPQTQYRDLQIKAGSDGVAQVVAVKSELRPPDEFSPSSYYSPSIVHIRNDASGPLMTVVPGTEPQFGMTGWARYSVENPVLALDASNIPIIAWTEFHLGIGLGLPLGQSSDRLIYSSIGLGGKSLIDGIQGDGVISWLPDMTIDADGARHFVWTRQTWNVATQTYAAGRVLYSQGTGGAVPLSLGPNAGGAGIVADSRGRPHAVWGNADGTMAYAARIDSTWHRQDPAVAAPQSAGIAGNNVRSVAISPNDQIHVAGHHFYTRTLETGLGVRDAQAQVPVFPGAALNAASGNLHYRLPLFGCTGVGPATSMSLSYNSLESHPGFIGPGWRFSYDAYLVDHQLAENDPRVPADNRPGEAITVFFDDARPIRFKFVSYDANNPALRYLVAEDEEGFFGKIERTNWGRLAKEYKLTTRSGYILTFSSHGRLYKVQDPTGNFLTIAFESEALSTANLPWFTGIQITAYRPYQIFDMQGNTAGGRPTTRVDYQNPRPSQLVGRRVVGITDPDGKRYDLAYSPEGHLASVSFAGAPGTPSFGFEHYTASVPGGRINQLKEVRSPRGQAAVPRYGWTLGFFADGRLQTVDDPSEGFLPEDPDNYHAVDPITARARIAFEYADDGPAAAPRRTTVTDRRAVQTVFLSEPRRALMIERRDPGAGTPGLTSVLRTFNAYGLLTDVRDRWEVTTSFVYDPPRSSTPHVRDNIATILRPQASGTGQQTVATYTYTNDGFNQVDFQTTHAGGQARVTDHDYNAFGQLVRVTLPALTRPDTESQTGVTVQYVYAGPRRQLTQTVNERGYTTDFRSHDFWHGLPREIARQGGSQARRLDYDRMGNVIATLEPAGAAGNEAPGWRSRQLDGMYRPEVEIDARGEITTYLWTLDSQLERVTPPAGGASTVEYDRRGLARSGSSPDGAWTQNHDANGNSRRFTNERGFISDAKLDALNRVIESRVDGRSSLTGVPGGGYVGHHVTQFTHEEFDGTDHFSRVIEIGPANRETKVFYNNRGLPKTVFAPDGVTFSQSFYDELDQVVATHVISNSVTQTCSVFFRDTRDRVERVRVQDVAYPGAPGANQLNTYYLYNKAGTLEKVVGPRGDVTATDGAGRYRDKITWLLDERERVTFVINGKGETVRGNIYGDDDHVSQVLAPDPATKSPTLVSMMTYRLSKRKELLEAIDREGRSVRTTYERLPGQVDRVTDQLSRETKATYHTATQRLHEKIEGYHLSPALQRKTVHLWANTLLSEIQVPNPDTDAPAGSMVSYRHYYDRADRLERREYPQVAAGTQMAPEQHFYNAYSELREVNAAPATPDPARTATLLYNDLGQNWRTDWTNAVTGRQERVFNGLGQVTSMKELNPSTGAELRRLDRSYAAWRGALTGEAWLVAGNPFKNQSHLRDPRNGFIEMTDPENKLHRWELDDAGQPIEERYEGVKVKSIAYTPGGLVDKEEIWNAAGTQAVARTLHWYDTRGRRERSVTASLATGEIATDYRFRHNDASEVTGINRADLGADFTFGLDAFGRVELETTPGNAEGTFVPPYENPALGPLVPGNESDESPEVRGRPRTVLVVPDRTASYAYDLSGNRTSQSINGVETTLRYNALHQLTRESTAGTETTVDYAYDAWGNQISRTTTVGAGAPVTESFGYNHLNLLSSFVRTGGAAATWQYEYWPTGERAARVNLTGGANEKHLSLYSGWNEVAEYLQVGAAEPAVTATYIQGLGLDQKSTKIAWSGGQPVAGGRRHFLTGAVGTLGATLGEDGLALDGFVRDAWGNLLASQGSAAGLPGFAQRPHDNESGLVQMRFRMYDPRTGRFTQNDPLRGNRPSKHYLYGSNNPLSRIDPMGLEDTPEGRARILRNFTDSYGNAGLALLDLFVKAGGSLAFKERGWLRDWYSVDHAAKNIEIDTTVEGRAADSLFEGLIDAIPIYRGGNEEAIATALGMSGRDWQMMSAAQIVKEIQPVLSTLRVGFTIVNSGAAVASGIEHLATGDYAAALGDLVGPGLKGAVKLVQPGVALRTGRTFAQSGVRHSPSLFDDIYYAGGRPRTAASPIRNASPRGLGVPTRANSGVTLFHGSDLASVDSIVRKGIDKEAARALGGGDIFWTTTDLSAARLFAQANPRLGSPAVVGIRLSEDALQRMLAEGSILGDGTTFKVVDWEALNRVAKYSRKE